MLEEQLEELLESEGGEDSLPYKMRLIFILLLNILVLTSLAFAQIGDPVGDISGVVIEDKTLFESFLDLLDTPSSYSGSVSRCVTVNGGENALEFTICPGDTGGTTKGTNNFYLFNSSTIIFFNETTLNRTISLFGNESFVNIDGDTMTGNLTLNDGVSLLLGTLGEEGNIFSNGDSFEIQSFANKNLNIKVNNFSTGSAGANISIIGSTSLQTLDSDGGNIIILAGDGGITGEQGSGGLIWLRGGTGNILRRGVHIKNDFSASPDVDGTNSLYVEGVIHTDNRAKFERGLVVNDLGGSAGVDDLRVETNTENRALFVDASIDHVFINVESNYSKNATFVEDVIILGTLFGGSPVRIAGVNITDDTFDLMENRNSSSRFILQNTNESTNATAVISAVNDVGGSMFIGIGSSSFVLGGISRPNITALASKSRGDMIFANFFNKAFIWLYNPQDDNDPKNLVEVMRVDSTGLNVTGNITSDNVFLPQYIFSHTDETIALIGASIWRNVTFGEDEAHIKLGIDHHHDDVTNDTFEIHADGIYDISYGLTLIDTSPGATDIDMAARMVFVNETEISGSVFQTDIIKQDIETSISHRFLVKLVVGNKIKLQFIASDADVELSDHSIFGDKPESAMIVITKIANL